MSDESLVCECDALSEYADYTNEECIERRAQDAQDAMEEDFWDDPDFD